MSITPSRIINRQRVGSRQLNRTFEAVDSVRGSPSSFQRTTGGTFPAPRSDRRVAGGAVGYKRPFDIAFYIGDSPSTKVDSFALYTWDTASRGAIAWIAGAKIAITATGFTFESTPMRWELDTQVTATSYIYLEVDREANTAKLLLNTSGFTNGTDNKETFPLYYVPWDTDHIVTSEVVDLRGAFHWVAGA